MKKYYTINVPGKHGYSIMVSSDEDLSDEEVINRAYDKGLFEGQEDDVDYAIVDNLIDEKDAKRWGKDNIQEI
jgi:hypothetical protein